MDEFDREYFIQTRQEIDTIKREMNQFLYFSVLVVGAIGFAVAQNEKAGEFFAKPLALVTEVASLLIITSLFWLRRLNLQQIADRWFVLRRVAHRHFSPHKVAEMMEGVVCARMETSATYTKQEHILNVAISTPVYSLLVITGCSSSLGIPYPWGLVVTLAIVGFHLLASRIVLRPMSHLNDPLPAMSDRKEASPAHQ